MFKRIDLPYGIDALEPIMDAETVDTHHNKHHATYEANFNKAAEDAGLMDKDLEWILGNLDTVSDENLRMALRNNGGGLYNHNLFFEELTPGGASEPKGALLDAINEAFGSFDAMKEKLSALAVSQFGSGWAWLEQDSSGKLYATKSPNQDNPISVKSGHTPIFTIDVWEHAYYLKYKNLRASYVENLWKIVNWDVVSEKYGK